MIKLYLFFMLETFLNYLKNEKRYSINTVIAYESDLIQFRDFLLVYYDLGSLYDGVESLHLRSWTVHLIDANNSARTVNRKLTSLKAFYRFLLLRKTIQHNPASSLKSPKVSKKLPHFVSENEMVRLFDEVVFDDEFENERNRLIIELLYATGVRLSELIHIKRSDILIYEASIKVIGKRNKERVVPIYKSLLESLSAYLKKHQPSIDADGYLFLTKKGAKLYPRLVYRIVNTYLSATTTSEKRSPHVVRHTFATHLLNNGAELNTIKELLGHTSLSATQVYTHNSIEKLKKIYQQAHPRA